MISTTLSISFNFSYQAITSFFWAGKTQFLSTVSDFPPEFPKKTGHSVKALIPTHIDAKHLGVFAMAISRKASAFFFVR